MARSDGATRSTLIGVAELRAALARGDKLLILDCGFDLADAQAGARAYGQGHLPGAVYAHLEADLSAPKTGRNGRHPLPAREQFAAVVGRWGLRPDVQAVCYDAQGGPYAARAWWMLRWLGHRAAAVLDGGVAAWVAAGGELSRDMPAVEAAAPYPVGKESMPVVDAQGVLGRIGQGALVDARSAERFRGDVEPLDPVAGHIPGAQNRFFKDNLGADGCFLPAEQLHATFSALGAPPREMIHQCGSGVTACHNLLAMEHAGLAGSSLYPGSWSEWCSDPARPVARG